MTLFIICRDGDFAEKGLGVKEVGETEVQVLETR